ncbi:MAG: DUF3343 domain-containing protein [Clostridia bacterium]|nr:DUF3343 domain-containing protein [Clostridia bacterium]
MDCKYMVFSSVTYSLRGMSLLQKKGIPSRLEKIKNIPSLGGCGYALAVDDALFANALSIIQNEGLKIIEVLESKDGL